MDTWSFIFSLKVWENRYEVGRIDLDDCLSSVEYQWIMFAVFIPVGSMAFVITGKSFSEALIFASTNPQYDDRLFIELQDQYLHENSKL